MASTRTAADLQDAIELDAYNAAFYALGLRWHWDRAIYEGLCRETADARGRLGVYLGRHHPHLLRA